MKSDVIVFCGDANDVGINNAKLALKCITNFIKENSHTNIILLSVTHRHDLMESSCVNNEIRSFNRKLIKYVKTFKHTTFLETDSNREFLTLHGSHLNELGKEINSTQIVSQIYTLLKKK
jgi:hypothetical protein